LNNLTILNIIYILLPLYIIIYSFLLLYTITLQNKKGPVKAGPVENSIIKNF